MKKLIKIITYYQVYTKRLLQIFSGVLIILFYNNCGQGFETSLDSGAASSPSVAATTTSEPSPSQPDGNKPDVVTPLEIVDSGPNSEGAVLDVDFSNRPLGLYRDVDIRVDFNINLNGYNDSVHGEKYSLKITEDPTSSGRGHVMRSVHYKGKAGTSVNAGGFRWRADMPPADEYYFAYDYYITNDHIFPKNFKMPGLISNDLLRASHPTGIANTTDGLEGFTAFMQAYSDDAWHRGDGSLAVLYYDKDRISGVDWLNTNDPTSEAKVGTYRIPRGEWITIEQRMQLNTVNKRNGIMQVWINGELMLDENTHKWIANNTGFDNSKQKIDGIFMTSYYGGRPTDPLNHAAQTQYHYYDNFVVSSSPITH